MQNPDGGGSPEMLEGGPTLAALLDEAMRQCSDS